MIKMKNKAYQIVNELDKKLNIFIYENEETIDIVLKVAEENNLPSEDIAKYITTHILDNIIAFTGNKDEVYKLIKNIVEEE